MSSETAREQRKDTAPTDEAHRDLARDYPREEPQKNYHTILEQQMTQAEEELERPASALLLSGFAAGLDLSFGPLTMAVGLTLTKDVFSKPAQEIFVANLYAVGFIFVVLGRSALFTEHTTSAVLPVLAKRAPITRLVRLWALVLIANIAGGALFAAVAVRLGPALGVVELSAFGQLAIPLVNKATWVMLVSAIGAGWIMGLLTWLVTASRDTVSQIIIVWLATTVIGLTKLHHSIAGTTEVLMGAFAGAGITAADYGRFILWVAVGNAIGGALFVALLKFSSVQRSVE